MCDIFDGYFMYVFHEFFFTSHGGISIRPLVIACG